MLAGHFLEPHKKGYKAIENRKKGLIVQRQSITFATLLALYRRVHRQAPQNVSKKLILWCIKEKYKSILWLTHPQVQIWQMHFSSFLAASEAEEGFLVASVETMLWCDPRFLTRQKREFYSECWAQQRPQGRLTSSPVMLKAQMDIQVCTVNRSAQSSTIPASLRRTKRQMPRCEQKGCASYLFLKIECKLILLSNIFRVQP